MSDVEGWDENELQLHDPFVLPDELELEHEIKRPRWWYAQQLRLAGATWDEIATALGYQSGPTAQTTVKRALEGQIFNRTTRQEAIELELERLDMLQLVVWRRARQGDLKYIDTVLKIMAQRAKYYGLDDKSYEDEKQDNSTIIIGGDEQSYLAAIKAAQSHQKPIEGQVA